MSFAINENVAEIRRRIFEGSHTSIWYTKVTNMLRHHITKHTPRELGVIIHRIRLGYKCTWEKIEGREEPVLRECKYCEEESEDQLQHYLIHCPITQELRETLGLGEERDKHKVATQIWKNQEAISAFLRSYPPPR